MTRSLQLMAETSCEVFRIDLSICLEYMLVVRGGLHVAIQLGNKIVKGHFFSNFGSEFSA
eukprot:m.139478 g.139478  ORF g.139478 m.139478 type:complete len:60 (+) comp15947_c0_seq2:1291-1470(+)